MMMRKFAASLIVLTFIAQPSVFAQDADTQRTAEDREDRGEWGWLGLLGLAGLLGLKRRDRDVRVDRTTAAGGVR
jgi:MYXO-CTERM domain-containing protein